MKVSTKALYGVLALADIALNSENGASVPAQEIAERQDVSKKYLEHILSMLRRAGYVRGRRGINGGYALAQDPGFITLYDVFSALDVSILEGMENNESRSTGWLREAANVCLWERINSFLVDFTKNMTLEDFIGECKKRAPSAWDMYVI